MPIQPCVETSPATQPSTAISVIQIRHRPELHLPQLSASNSLRLCPLYRSGSRNTTNWFGHLIAAVNCLWLTWSRSTKGRCTPGTFCPRLPHRYTEQRSVPSSPHTSCVIVNTWQGLQAKYSPSSTGGTQSAEWRTGRQKA